MFCKRIFTKVLFLVFFLHLFWFSTLPSIENSYLQTTNSKQQTTNRNETMVLKLTREWGTTEVQFQLRVQNLNPTNCSNKSNYGCRTPTLQSWRKQGCKISTLQSARTGRTAGAGLQSCKVEANKRKQEQTTNNKPVSKHQEVQLQLQDLNFAKLKKTTISSIQRTNEQATTSEPVMSVENNIAQIHCR